MPRRLRIATRSSPLALWQARRVAELLGGDCELIEVESLGDRLRDRPLHEIGGQGVFVKEVQAAVQRGDADLAVHSAKDLPAASSATGLVLASVPERDDPRDCLVGCTLDGLKEGATVASGSVRRRAQLAALRPDLKFVDLRGNMATRLGKVPPGGAIVAAYAALRRLGVETEVAEVLEPQVVLPQVAQGALAAECRSDDGETVERLKKIEDLAARRQVDAERSFLRTLGGACDLPVGALAETTTGTVRLRGIVAALDGSVVMRAEASGPDPEAVGETLARHLLDGEGAADLLEDGQR